MLERILYAEDDEDIQQIALLALETVGGFTVKTCKNGLEVLDAIEQFHPQLLLLDVMMPHMDGPKAYEKIREIEKFKHTPVIFMTAKVQDEEVKKYLAMGAVDVIAKPFNPMNLADQVMNIWEKSQA